MKKYAILLSALCLSATIYADFTHLDGPSTNVRRDGNVSGENWTYISRNSFGTGATAYTITKAGNYMLTESVTVTASTNAIEINSNDVVLDLGGHTINGTGGSSSDGILISAQDNVTVRNGHIRATTAGGINIADESNNVRIENITVTNPVTNGITIATSGAGVYLKNITVINDGASTGHGINASGALQNLTIDDFDISGIATAGKTGITIASGAYGITLKNGRVSNIKGDTSSDGITFAGACYDVTLENISVSDVAGQGIDLGGSYGVNARNITVATVAGGNGIDLGAGYGVTIDGFKIALVQAATAGSGINLATGADGITLKNGTISGVTCATGYGIALAGSHSGVTIENVEIANITGTTANGGINVATQCNALTIKNISITECTTASDGIAVAGASEGVWIEDAVITTISGDAIAIEGAALGVTLRNITVAGATDGIALDGAVRNVEITNVNLTNVTNGINIASTAGGVTVDGLRVAGAVDGILIAAASFGLRFKNLNISASSNDAIAVDGAAYDIIVENFNIANSTNNGIIFNVASYNVILKNGTITNIGATYNAVRVDPSAHSFTLENITCSSAGLGILFDGSADSTSITDVTLKNCNVSNITDASAYGIKFVHTESILMQDCTVAAVINNGAESDVNGVLFSTCTNVKCVNIKSGGHSGDQAYGFNFTTVNGGYLENCSSQGNYCDSETAGEKAVGFYMSTSNSITFKNCLSSGHQGGAEAYGWWMTGSKGNVFSYCQALRNHIVNSGTGGATGNVDAKCMGFYSTGGFGNSYDNCESNNHNAGNLAAVAAGEGAVGFYASNEAQTSYYKSIARGNGSSTTHAANAAGFYLDITDGNCKYCQIRACEASMNCTTATSGTSAYGFRDTTADTTNIIIDCFAFGNSDAATTRVVTNYYMDLPIGGTTAANWPRVEANMDG